MKETKLSAIGRGLFGLGLLASMLTLGSLLGHLHWTLDLFSHFHIQYTLLLFIAGLALPLMHRGQRYGLLLIPALLVNLYFTVPFFISDMPKNVVAALDTTPSLRVMCMNISTSSAGYPQVIELIRTREPDIIFLSEVRSDLVALLETELGELYPVQHAEPSRLTLGLAILARDVSVNVRSVRTDADVGRMQRRYLRADFRWEETPVTLVGIHPLPPLRGEWARGRDREIGILGALAEETEHPFVLTGDLNASPWSRVMRALTVDTGLRYASDGYGTWPTWFPAKTFAGPLLGAPLDHILVSPQWTVVDYTESGDIGSDHVPIQADLVLR